MKRSKRKEIMKNYKQQLEDPGAITVYRPIRTTKYGYSETYGPGMEFQYSIEEAYTHLEKNVESDFKLIEKSSKDKKVKLVKLFKKKKYKKYGEVRFKNFWWNWLFIIKVDGKPVKKYTIGEHLIYPTE